MNFLINFPKYNFDDTILNGDINLKQYPYHVIWHITNACNLKCPYCYTNSDIRQIGMEYKKAKEIVRIINNSNSKNVSIIGGEPFLLRYLTEIINAVREDISVNIESNLTVFNESKYNEIKRKINQWNTSIDSSKETMHNLTRGGFAKTIESIKILLKNNERVSVNIVVTKDNINDLEDTIVFLKNLGDLKRINLACGKPVGRGQWNKSVLYDDDLKKATKVIEKLIKKYNVTATGWNSRYLKNDMPSCFCGLYRLTIDWNGNAYPCELMVGTKGVNTLEYDKLDEVIKRFKFWAYQTLIIPPSYKSKGEFEKYDGLCCRYLTKVVTGATFAKPPLSTIKTNTPYEVLGYERFSPLFMQGKERWKDKTTSFIDDFAKSNEKICDLGCGGGIWVFYLEEKCSKPSAGVENNPTMVELFKIYKKNNKGASKIFSGDALDFVKRHKNKYSYLLLDNFIVHFSREQLKKLFKNMDSALIEVVAHKSIKEGKTKYEFNGRLIEEYVKIIGKNKIEKTFYNGISKAKIVQYYYSVEDIISILKSCGFKIKYECREPKLYAIIAKSS